MKRPAITAVLFDLDGTLLDTAPDLVGALNHLRAHEGLPPVAVSDYQRFVSQGALGLIRAGLPDGMDERLYEPRRQRLLDHYARHLCEGTRSFDGVELLLEALQAQGIPWGIVTNKPEFLTLPLVEAIGWSRRACFVISGDTLAQRKPHPAPLLLACELAGVAPAQAVMVGDDPRDLIAGAAAGTQTTLAAYGYGAREVLDSDLAPDHVIETPIDLLAWMGLCATAPGDRAALT